MQPKSFERFAGLLAILAGVSGFLYAVAFIILRQQVLYSLFLTLLGFFATAALVGVYNRLKETDAAFALWALLLGLIGAAGTAIHGGFDLAYALNPPPTSTSSVLAPLPSEIDPRGLLTFGFAGIALFVVAWLIGRSGKFPKGLAYLAYLSAFLFIVIYLETLVLGPAIATNLANPIVIGPILLNGFIASPVWYLWLGIVLWRGK